jgi:hypothetical protein
MMATEMSIFAIEPLRILRLAHCSPLLRRFLRMIRLSDCTSCLSVRVCSDNERDGGEAGYFGPLDAMWTLRPIPR